jgi:acetyltransferase
LTATDLEREFESVRRHADAFATDSHPVAVSVEKYIDHKIEFIIGLKTDEVFGPIILFGLGGVFTEVLRDYVIGLIPLTKQTAREMLLELKAFPVLRSSEARGELSLDKLTDALTKISDMGAELKNQIAALDINPIVFTSSCPNGVILDAKVHLKRDRVAQ